LFSVVPSQVAFQSGVRPSSFTAKRQAVDALGGHMAPRCNLGRCAVEVHPDQHPKLVTKFLRSMSAATTLWRPGQP
jgi:hypothetical protein